MDQPYSKREQDHFFTDLFNRMDKQDAALQRIEEQTLATKEQAIKTNGRVSMLEAENEVLKNEIDGLNKTKETVTKWGGAIALACFLLGLAPFAYSLSKDYFNSKKVVNQVVTPDVVASFVEGVQKVLEEQATVTKQ